MPHFTLQGGTSTETNDFPQDNTKYTIQHQIKILRPELGIIHSTYNGLHTAYFLEVSCMLVVLGAFPNPQFAFKDQMKATMQRKMDPLQ